MRIPCIFVLFFFCAFAFADSTPPDACKLLTADDVAKMVGPGFQLSPFRGTASDNSNCGYLKDKTNVVNLTVVNAGQDAAAALSELQKMYTQQNRKVVPLEGAGAGAFYVEFTNAYTKQIVGTTHVGKGTWHGILDVTINGKPDADAEQKLAKIVYSRFP